MKRNEIDSRQNWVIYVLMAVSAALALAFALWYHARRP
jgi:hypothetical protein